MYVDLKQVLFCLEQQVFCLVEIIILEIGHRGVIQIYHETLKFFLDNEI